MRPLPLRLQMLAFGAIGAGNTAVDGAVFAIAVHAFGAREGIAPIVASMLGFVAGATHSYAWNSRVTFRERSRGRTTLLRFACVVLAGALLSGAVFALASAAWPHAATRLYGAKAVSIAVCLAANFMLMRRWAFGQSIGGETVNGMRARHVIGHPGVLVLLVAVAVRVPFVLMPGFWWDINLFRVWADTAVREGLAATIRRPDMDYVGYNYVLLALGSAYAALLGARDLATSAGFGQLLKLVPLVGDLGVCVLLYTAGSRWAAEWAPGWTGRIPWLRQFNPGRRVGLAAALLYALNPAVIYDSAYWGQVDSLIALAMLASVLLLVEGRPGLAGATIALGFLVKPQPVLLVPLLCWVAWWREGPAGLLRGLSGAAVVLTVGLGYLSLIGVGGEVEEIYNRLFEAGDQVSVSAWNIWWVAYRLRPWIEPGDVALTAGPLTLTIARLSQALLALATALACASVGTRPTPERVLLAGAFLVFSFFMLTMKMHERYLFALFAFLAPAAVSSATRLWLYALLSTTFALNLYALFPFPPPAAFAGGRRYIEAPADIALSLVNAALYLAFAAALIPLVSRGRPGARASAGGMARGAGTWSQLRRMRARS